MSGIAAIGLFGIPARAAKTISATAGPAERTIEVADLEIFLQDGTITRELRWYADQLTEQQQDDLRQLLQERFEVDPVTVSRFARLAEGEALLRRLTVLIENDDPERVLKALRAALTLAAFDDEGLTIANVIRKYPLSDLRVDVARVLRATQQAKQLFFDSESVFNYVRDRATTDNPEADENAATPPSPALDPRQQGDELFTTIEIDFANPARPDAPAVLADLYVPSADIPAPLIVISHGVASSRETFAYLAEHLASRGFAVAAIAHPDTDELRFEQFFGGFAQPPEPELFLQRPQDISSLLDEIERSPRLQERIQTDRVGLIGQSLGGYTVLASSGAQLNFSHLYDSCRDAEAQILPFNLSTLLQCRLRELPQAAYEIEDDRVAAVLAINPVANNVFGPQGMGALDVPLLAIGGDLDFFAPAVTEQIYPFAWAGSEEKYLVLMDKGTHFSFLRGNEAGVFELPEIAIGPDPKIAHPILKGLATAFFETYINQAEDFAPFITNTYLNTDAEPFQFAVSRSLTELELEEAISQTAILDNLLGSKDGNLP
ncbi:MAG: alpha/beta hydrolase [Cyanobacteria bacterium P01_D01_bin.123]